MDQQREPIFSANQPLMPLVLAGAIVAGYATQYFTGEDISPFVFSPTDLTDGRWPITLLSSLFVHGSWSHVLMNAVFLLAFGTPVARYLGRRPGAAGAFVLFYLACGALAGLGFALAHWNQPVAIVGASGAVSGLAGAAARLIAGRGTMGKIWSPAVIGMGAAWLVVNLLTAIIGFAPGLGDAQVGWEAHLAGFAAGVALAGVLPWLKPKDVDR